ncbi:hypothetical protein [Parvibacter caecicola]|uniref:hypothetical protein n=1 Tax=Parvibacter caecicola TaxID=747645 RepID=UPI00272F3398|nr:hypothetical protein [Parvibacter caecicola]
MHQITVNGQLLDSKSGSFTENGRTVNYHNFRVFDSDNKSIFKANNPRDVQLPEPMFPCVFVFDVNAGEKYTKLELVSCKPSLAPKA